MREDPSDIDWSKATFEGARREQIRRWRALSVRQRLEALDEMTDLAQRIAGSPKTSPRPAPRG